MSAVSKSLKPILQIGARLGIQEKKNQLAQKIGPYFDSEHFGKKNTGYLILTISAFLGYEFTSFLTKKRVTAEKQKLEMKPYAVQEALARSGVL
ncbi:hypothetical protein GPALN_006142 [Globodera pallida]|nr:hypothetical protein GPALN_006142 [Globodera pallida]